MWPTPKRTRPPLWMAVIFISSVDSVRTLESFQSCRWELPHSHSFTTPLCLLGLPARPLPFPLCILPLKLSSSAAVFQSPPGHW